MKYILSSLILIILAFSAQGQQNYDISLIPKELLPYASAVIRNEEVSVEVKDYNNVIYHEKKVITVLNKNGDDMAHMAIYYEKKSNSIRYVKGASYDEFGKLISKFSERDFKDESAAEDNALFEDYRVKHYLPAITQYPYTIEYDYEVRNKQSLYFDDWIPNHETGMSVEKSSYKFVCNPSFNIRYKEFNLPVKAIISNNKDGQKIYSWQITYMKALKYEPFSPDWRTFSSRVIIAPEKFEYAGISGSFTNWKELGKWSYDKLISGRADVPAETIEHMKAITANTTSPKLKAKKIYEYMQRKTHYVSVQVGIGGFQPFLASDVDKNGYGDCKALVNYTKALLSSVNIESYYCVVQSGSRKVSLLNDFASMNQGNHIILCIPFKNDTTWLECTSQQIPFGFLSDFTDDRTVLACTAEGGQLLHTPKYSTEENLEKRKAEFVLNDTGELTGSIKTLFKGTDYDDRDYVINDSQADRIKEIKKIYPLNNMEVAQLTLKQDKSALPVTYETIELSARDYASPNNGALYFMINSLKRVTGPPHQVNNRLNEVEINRGFTEDDEIIYTLPKGYRLDTQPLNIDLVKPFGNFKATMSVQGNQLIYKRKFQLKDGVYSKETYPDLVDFYQDAYDADNYNAKLVKTN